MVDLVVNLASFPGSCAWAERKEPGTHCFVHAQFPQESWEFVNSIKSVCYTNLCKTCCLFPPERCLPLTTLCRRWRRSDKGNKLFAYRKYACVRPFLPIAMARDWLSLSLWSLSIIVNEAMQTVNVRAILFLTSKPPEGVSQAVYFAVWPFTIYTDIPVNFSVAE